MRRLIWLATAAPLFVPSTAQAQQATPASAVQPNVSVADRGRPDYAPIGGRIGSFFLYPRLDAQAQYNTNLRATETDTVADAVLYLRPSVDLASNWAQHRLSANAYYEQTLHAKYGGEDTSQYGASVDGQYDISGDTSFQLSALAGRVAEPRSNINTSGASRSPITYTNLGLSAALRHDFVRLQMIANGSINSQKFDDSTTFAGTPLSQGFRDNTSYNVGLEGRYMLGASTRLIGRIRSGAIDYDENPYLGFDRNSRYFRAEGGVGLQLGSLLFGDVTIGYYRQNNNDPRFLDGSGLSFMTNLLYSPTAATSIRLTADRSIEPGGSVVTPGNIRSTLALTVDHELLPNMVVSAYGRYAHVDPQGLLGKADEYEGRLSTVYYVNRRFRLNASLAHVGRSSTAFGSFDQTTLLAGVTVTL